MRSFSGLQFDREGPTSLRLVMLNVPEGGKVVWPGDSVPEVEDIQDFVLLSMQGALEPMGIKDRVSGFDDDDGDVGGAGGAGSR